ncbi:MAG: NAD(P)-dependent alcohol dehydrogenase [Oscillospiraceae bacterium]|nr:NAD(P)-dependent alcohol dehydrogenase [Oscillospiraceae bacterium]
MNICAIVVNEANGPLCFEDIELAPPNRGELLIKVTACGFCHTDELVRVQALPVPLPVVLGHEGCGIVESVGAEVTEFSPGDRVCVSFGHCGVCARCRSGMPTMCDSFVPINFGGVQPDGTSRLSRGGESVSTLFGQSTFATYAVVNAGSAIKVPDDIPLEITGPLGCGIQTGAGTVLNMLKPRPGSSIAVFGCGSVGLSAIMAAKLAGCGMIIGVDLVSSRLDLALELGATHVINGAETPDVTAEIRKLTGLGTDASIDTTGKSIGTRMALNAVRPGGSAYVIGGGGDVTFNVETELMGVGKSLIGGVEGNSNPKVFIPELMEHYRAGRFPFDKMITFYDFDDVESAVRDTKSGKAVKAVLKMT